MSSTKYCSYLKKIIVPIFLTLVLAFLIPLKSAEAMGGDKVHQVCLCHKGETGTHVIDIHAACIHISKLGDTEGPCPCECDGLAGDKKEKCEKECKKAQETCEEKGDISFDDAKKICKDKDDGGDDGGGGSDCEKGCKAGLKTCLDETSDGLFEDLNPKLQCLLDFLDCKKGCGNDEEPISCEDASNGDQFCICHIEGGSKQTITPAKAAICNAHFPEHTDTAGPCPDDPIEACNGKPPTDPNDCGCEEPPPPTPCGQAEAPACDGACPEGQACSASGEACECKTPPPTPCGDAEAPACDGACPEGQACSASGEACECKTPPPTPCGDAEAPACDGACPEGQACSASGEACECKTPPPTPCGDAEAPACDGACPEGQACSGSGENCSCEPVTSPCCAGGSCPAGESCVGTDPASCGCEPDSPITPSDVCNDGVCNLAVDCLCTNKHGDCPVQECQEITSLACRNSLPPGFTTAQAQELAAIGICSGAATGSCFGSSSIIPGTAALPYGHLMPILAPLGLWMVRRKK